MCIYHVIKGFIGDLLSGRVRQGQPIDFLIESRKCTRDADPRVREFADELYRRAVELQILEATIEELDGRERDENLDRQLEIREWFDEQVKLIDRLDSGNLHH